MQLFKNIVFLQEGEQEDLFLRSTAKVSEWSSHFNHYGRQKQDQAEIAIQEVLKEGLKSLAGRKKGAGKKAAALKAPW